MRRTSNWPVAYAHLTSLIQMEATFEKILGGLTQPSKFSDPLHPIALMRTPYPISHHNGRVNWSSITRSSCSLAEEPTDLEGLPACLLTSAHSSCSMWRHQWALIITTNLYVIFKWISNSHHTANILFILEHWPCNMLVPHLICHLASVIAYLFSAYTKLP